MTQLRDCCNLIASASILGEKTESRLKSPDSFSRLTSGHTPHRKKSLACETREDWGRDKKVGNTVEKASLDVEMKWEVVGEREGEN